MSPPQSSRTIVWAEAYYFALAPGLVFIGVPAALYVGIVLGNTTAAAGCLAAAVAGLPGVLR